MTRIWRHMVPAPTDSRAAGPLIASALFFLFEIILFALIIHLIVLAVRTPPATLMHRGAEITLNIFHLIPIILVLSWVGLLMAYFGWCTYFYNFNFGRSRHFWLSVLDGVEQGLKEGKTKKQVYEEMGAPTKNPHGEETFGWPTGTVRGSLALTIIVGGLALLINFFGGEPFFTSDGVVSDYFDFFKTAFLMVVAFYFGTKGLDIIERQRTLREEARGRRSASLGGGAPAMNSEFALEPATLEGDGALSDGSSAGPTPTADMQAPTEAGLQASVAPFVSPDPASTAAITAGRDQFMDEHFPHLRGIEAEQAASLSLNDEDVEEFAGRYDLEEAVVRAVIQVESDGKGFLKDGRPKILFEGHVFWQELEKHGLSPDRLAKSHPTILYKRWTRDYYRPGAAEYGRLEEAKQIHESGALCATSWGLFQMLGRHYEMLGYEDIHEFVAAHEESEKDQLDALGRYLEAFGLVPLLRSHNWADFARQYNGKAYARDHYDARLQASYERFSS